MRIFWTEEPEVCACWLRGQVALGYFDPAFGTRRSAGLYTPSGDGYEAIAVAQHRPTGSQMIWSRDVGHHTSGWFKNPDYERCLHLSICYRDPETGAFYGSQKWTRTGEWLRLMFGDSRRLVWTEPPFTPEGKRDGVWHFRLFCDAGWQPTLPRGEVYSKELTELGWRSFSEVRELREKALDSQGGPR